MNIFQNLLNKVRGAYKQADKAAGGWLPGGGVAAPLTKAVFPPQPFPKRSEELNQITGVKARFIDPEKTPSVVRLIAPIVSPLWGTQDYANPLLKEVGLSGYKGGKTDREKMVEFHELGHLNSKDKNIYSHLGVLGRSMQGLSKQTGNLPLTDLAAGLALQYADAPEEDRAERFAKKYAKKGNYSSPIIYEDNTSNYGNELRSEGKELTSSALSRLTDPFGIVSGASQFINQKRADPIRKEIQQIEPGLKNLVVNMGDEISPELLRLGKRHAELSRQLEALNIR